MEEEEERVQPVKLSQSVRALFNSNLSFMQQNNVSQGQRLHFDQSDFVVRRLCNGNLFAVASFDTTEHPKSM